MIARIITLDMLRQHNACSDQQELFVDTFGQSAKLTRRNWARAIKVGLSVFWMERLLSAPAWAAYVKVRALALAEYVKASAPAQAEYEKVRDAALAEYEKVRALALAEYVKVRDAALYDALVADLAEVSA